MDLSPFLKTGVTFALTGQIPFLKTGVIFALAPMMGKTKFYRTTKNRIKFGLMGKKIYGIDRDRACQHNRAPLKTDGWMVDYL